MLTSITPLGERGRGQRWGVTALALVIGHLVGGAALGLLMASGATVVAAAAGQPGEGFAVMAVAVAVAAAVVFDLAGGVLPGRRQVDERWLTAYRGWVYGIGFGVQLGFGLVTVVNTALFGAFVVAGVLSPPFTAVLLGAGYGLVRGVTAAAGGWVQRGEQLRRLHRWVDRRETTARNVGDAMAAVAVVAALVVLVAG